jgi:alpha-N-arabinofuranosidase
MKSAFVLPWSVFTLFSALAVFAAEPASPAATAVIRVDQPGVIINPNLYGQFAEHLGSCIYGGIWVGPESPIPNTRGIRNDVIGALKNLRVPVLRWPGGCFADEYHWKNGIGPREQRPSMYNSHWGGVVENNAFGTHEFFDLCELIGTEAYVCGNVGSGTVQEMMEWIEYMTADNQSPMANLRRANGRDKPWKVPYFGVGNESWGCGGNMTPEYYANEYRRYNTFVKNYLPSAPVYRIASGSNAEDVNWTEVMMKNAGQHMNGLSLHYYTLPRGDWRKPKGPATGFNEEEYFTTLRRTLAMDPIIKDHSKIMDKYDPEKKVGLVIDEWGIWTDVEPGTNPGFLYQQNSLRDALLAALNFNIFHQHAERVTMTNIAQMINVLQAMILTEGDKMVLTPTYHVFEMYNVHQGATFLPTELKTSDYTLGAEKIPAVSITASRDKAGKIHVSLVNTNPNEALTVSCKLSGAAAKSVSGRVLTGPAVDSHNTFAAPEVVKPTSFTGASLSGDTLMVALPPKSVVALEL